MNHPTPSPELSRRERKKVDTRRRIFEAAVSLFREKGFEATTTREELRLELDAIRDMLPKALSRRQAEQTWRQLEPIMISIAAPPP